MFKVICSKKNIQIGEDCNTIHEAEKKAKKQKEKCKCACCGIIKSK